MTNIYIQRTRCAVLKAGTQSVAPVVRHFPFLSCDAVLTTDTKALSTPTVCTAGALTDRLRVYQGRQRSAPTRPKICTRHPKATNGRRDPRWRGLDHVLCELNLRLVSFVRFY